LPHRRPSAGCIPPRRRRGLPQACVRPDRPPPAPPRSRRATLAARCATEKDHRQRSRSGFVGLMNEWQQRKPPIPAKSKAQQKAAGAALAAKRGEQKVSKLKGASKSMYESMTEEQLEDFASTKRKGKPEHVG